MSDQSVTLTHLRSAIARELGYNRTYASCGATEQQDIDDCIQAGIRQVYFPAPIGGVIHRWSFLQPTTTMTAWGSVATTLDGPNTVRTAYASTLSGAHTATTTCTAAGSIFASWMAGETITIDNIAYTIDYVTSATACVLTSAIASEAGGEVVQVGVTTVTVDDAIFNYASMVGKSVTIDETDYTILALLSTTTCAVSGNASAEDDEAAVSITADGNYEMPATFGGMISNPTFGQDMAYSAITMTSEGQILRARQRDVDATGIPRLGAIRPRACDGSASQRFELILWPIPDSDYLLIYKFNVLVDQLVANSSEYPHGTAAHAETILASCLAIAEQRIKGERGVHYAYFMERLQASIAYDLSIMAAQTSVLGQNRNRDPERLGRSSQYVLVKGERVG